MIEDGAATLYSRAETVIATDVAGESVFLDTRNWAVFEFDPTATAIWGLLEKPINLPDLVQALQRSFEVDEAQCRADTKAFLDEMAEKGVVTLVQGRPEPSRASGADA